MIIGGHEDRAPESDIMQAIRDRAKKGSIVIMTAGTQLPKEVIQEYTDAFQEAGIAQVNVIDIRTREDGFKAENVKVAEQAAGIFFTGGDQLRITSQLGDSDVYKTIARRYTEGMTIMGTSAGAAMMAEGMIINGAGDESGESNSIGMAPGMNLLPGTVIDSHFAERGRMGRLLTAIAQNPALIGLGIDENTAAMVKSGSELCVIGSGAVYIVDGSRISYSSLSEKDAEGVVSIHDMTLHVLGRDAVYDLTNRRPVVTEQEQEASD